VCLRPARRYDLLSNSQCVLLYSLDGDVSSLGGNYHGFDRPMIRMSLIVLSLSYSKAKSQLP